MLITAQELFSFIQKSFQFQQHIPETKVIRILWTSNLHLSTSTADQILSLFGFPRQPLAPSSSAGSAARDEA